MINHIDEIKEILEKNIDYLIKEYQIKLIYIFGSFAKGTNIGSSDIDIAVLLEEKGNIYTRLNLLGELIDIFNREDIDLIILNEVNEVVKFQVIKYGKIMYMESQYEKVMFESKTMSRYMDMVYFRRTQEKYIHDKLMHIVAGK